MRKNITFIVLLAVAVLASGCVTNYQYASRGEVTMTDGATRNAVLYWSKDEGRLWYGKKYEQLDTSVNMRVCETVQSKAFSLGDEGYVTLPSRASDLRVAEVMEDGELTILAEEERLPDGETCGVILAGDTKVGTGGLPVGTRPTVTILCRSDMRPGRYPEVSKYEFSTVTRTETDEERKAPDPCVAID